MIGFNGGLIGGLANARDTSTAPSLPGVWTLPEQRNAKLALQWPVAGLKLLDAYTGASAAYSLRLLTTAYTGNLVTVRRSSDNTTQGFTELQITGSGAGSLANFCSGTDGFVTTWHDQSGNGNDATQATPGDQPKIFDSVTGVSTVNSKPCIRWDNTGSDNLNMTTRLTGVVSVFELLTIEHDITTGNTSFLLGDSTNYDYHVGSGTWLSSADAATAVVNGSNRLNNVLTDLHLTTRTGNQTLISMIHSGTAAVSQLTKDRTITSRSLKGAMQELILYSSSQSANVAGINADINLHYSIY